MAMTKRDELKRHVGYAYGISETAMHHLLEVRNAFEDVHPEYCELIDYIMTMHVMAQQGIESFCQHAWGTEPDKRTRWKGK